MGSAATAFWACKACRDSSKRDKNGIEENLEEGGGGSNNRTRGDGGEEEEEEEKGQGDGGE